MIGFAIDTEAARLGGPPIRFNGIEEQGPLIVIGGPGAIYSALERSARKLASIVFTPAINDREWPISETMFTVIETSWPALRRLQEIARLALQTQIGTSSSFERQAMSLGIKETIFAAVDAALLERSDAAKQPGREQISQFRTFLKIEEAISHDLEGPIYSAELARQVGLSVRTLQNMIRRYRGMSLHQYLRIRRLWLVRRQLLAGAMSVKAVALAYGFWHLGDFSRSYHSTFGELPSETLKRAK
jgi:AraC-like DNA-binding protein